MIRSADSKLALNTLRPLLRVGSDDCVMGLTPDLKGKIGQANNLGKQLGKIEAQEYYKGIIWSTKYSHIVPDGMRNDNFPAKLGNSNTFADKAS
jgi:hypothetical protein